MWRNFGIVFVLPSLQPSRCCSNCHLLTHIGNSNWASKTNFDKHGGYDMGLYYAHGRWYNQDTGLWLSPNEKGDYLYEPHNDPVNIAQSDGCQNHLPPTTPPIGGQTVDWIPSNLDKWSDEEQQAFASIKSDLLASATRHNTSKTNMDDNAFAALMMSVIHKEQTLPGAWDDPIAGGAYWFKQKVADLISADPSTGIANVRPSVALQILRGEVPGTSGQYCYKIQDLSMNQVLHQFVGTGEYPLSIAFSALQNNQTSLEFLAANLERGADRINHFKAQASVFNLATWHNGGVQTTEELRRTLGTAPRVIQYGNDVLSYMPSSLQFLNLSGQYNPYNPSEIDFINPGLRKP